jgi:hypothetical protein
LVPTIQEMAETITEKVTTTATTCTIKIAASIQIQPNL